MLTEVEGAARIVSDFVASMSFIPLSDREMEFNKLMAGLHPVARILVGSGVTARILIRPPESQVIIGEMNMLCAPGAPLHIGVSNMSNTQHNSGTFNAPVGFNQTFTNCFNAAQAVPNQELQQALKALI